MTTLDVPAFGDVKLPYGVFIDNEWSDSSDGKTFDIVNPATGGTLSTCAHASPSDVDRAVVSARKAFTTTWGNNVPSTERAALLFKLADLMERDAKFIGALESLNSGKGVRIATGGDVADSISCIRYYAGLADKSHGQTINHFGKDKFVYTVNQPIGVCGQIIPWNYPLQMWAWKIGPALAAGCTIVMKPSELTPLTALVMCDLIKEAGFPPGVVNTVPGLGATTGDAIARHMDIDKIAFTGSVITGRRISIAAAESNLKKVTLELGGKSPSLVFASSNIDEVAGWIALGIFYNSGQDCCAGSRVYVQSQIYEDFIQVLKLKAEQCKIGQPSDDETSFGPLISEVQRDKVLGYIESGRQEGARVLTGGQKWPQSNGGFWVEPTVIVDAKPNMRVVKEEIFGPVIVAAAFDTEEEAISLANATSYGLAAAVFTNDSRQATRISHALDAGTIWVNHYAYLHPGVPFGGFKQSGIGRELGTYGLEAYMQIKAVHQNISTTLEWPI